MKEKLLVKSKRGLLSELCITEEIKRARAVTKIRAKILLIHLEVSAHTSKNYGITWKAEKKLYNTGKCF